MIGVLVVFVIFVASVLLAARWPRGVLFSLAAIAPWWGLIFDIGINITMFQVVLAGLCTVMVARASQPGWSPPPLVATRLLSCFIVYAICWSLVQIAFLPSLQVGDSALRGPAVRAAVQMFLFLFNWSPVLLCGWLLRTEADVERMFRIFIISMAALSVLGWVQIALWYGAGFNPLPVGIVSKWLGGAAWQIREGQFGVEQLNIYRMNSLAGEPRDLGYRVALAMLFIQGMALTTVRTPGIGIALLWLFFLITLALTFSTSGAIIWVAGSAVLLPACWLFRVPIRRRGRSILTAIVALLLPVVLAVAAIEASGFPVLDVLAERTIERLGSDGAVEDFDLAILGYLERHPEAAIGGTGLGNAHLFAMPYLDPLYAIYAEGTVFIAKTGYLRLISEVGLIGTAVFLLWYLMLVLKVREGLARHPRSAPAIPAAAAALAAYFAYSNIIAEFYTFCGVMVALASITAREQVGEPVPA